MAITFLAAVFIRFEVYDLEIPLCADRGRPLGRYAYRLYRQQIEDNVPSQAASTTYTRVHRIRIIMTTMLVIFVALCILGLIMDLFPLHFPFDQHTLPINPSPSPPPKAPTECKLQGARQGTVQASISHTTGARHDLEICTVASNSTGRVDSPTPVLVESVGATEADSANRGRTPGVQAGPRCSTNSVAQRPASSTAGNSLSETQSSIIGERDSNEPGAGGPGPISPVGSCVPRGSAPNPAQLRLPPPQPTGAAGNIKKSLYPLILDPVGSIDRNNATTSSLACPSRELPWTPLDRALPVALQHLKNCYMLVVAVGVGGLKDPFIDLNFLQGIPESTVVHIRWLSNRKATPKRIRRKLRQLYIKAQKAARDSSWVLVYLTGMGDHQGNMRLFGRNTIGVQNLEGWLAEMSGSRLHVGVVFDVCRRPHISTAPNSHCSLALVWSCSMDQWAYALDFGESMPSSCFLNSVFLAAHDVLVGSESFEAAFTHRMAQQGELLQFIYRKRHEANGRCNNRPEGGKCDRPEPQVAEWRPAGFDTFLILGKLIISEFPHVAHRVEAKMTEKMKGWKFLCDMSVNAVATPVDTPLSSEARHSPIIDDTSYAWEGSEAESQALAPGGVSRLIRVEFALPRNNVSIFGYSV